MLGSMNTFCGLFTAKFAAFLLYCKKCDRLKFVDSFIYIFAEQDISLPCDTVLTECRPTRI